MSDLQAGPGSERSVTIVTTDRHFSWLQTQLALEISVQPWIHTAVTMIGFGLALVQFFHRLHELPGARTAILPNDPWRLGLALISCGILVLVTALWNLRWMRRDLTSRDFAPIAKLPDKRTHAPVYTVVHEIRSAPIPVTNRKGI